MGQCLEHGNIPLSQKKIPHIFIPLLVPMIILLLSFDYPTPIIIPLQSHLKKKKTSFGQPCLTHSSGSHALPELVTSWYRSPEAQRELWICKRNES